MITLSKLKSKWKNEYTFSLVITFVLGLFTHIYKFTNYLPNHDSIHNFYSDQNILESGRWLLSIACGFSSFYDLPWINGVLSLFFIGLTVILILIIFDVKNRFLIFLINALFLVLPPTTEILFFEFTADGYMLAMFLSAVSVYLVVRGIEKNKIVKAILLSSLLLCCSCGIYQAYISFALVLFSCYYILILLRYNYTKKVYSRYLISMLVSLVIGLFLYYIIWKICLIIQGVLATDYQGISQVGSLDFNTIVSAPKSIAKDLLALILEKNIFKYGISFYAVFNILFILFSVLTMIIVILKSKVYKSIFKMMNIIICIFLLPFIICIWRFTSSTVIYGPRMLQSVIILYAFFVLLCFYYIKVNCIKLSYYSLSIVMVFNLMVQANIAYYYLNYQYENSYSEAVYLKYTLNTALNKYGKNHKIAIVGRREDDVYLNQEGEANGTYIYTNVILKSLLTSNKHVENYLKNVLYFEGEFVDEKTIKEIESTDVYAKMKPFFDEGEIKMIDDVITVKLG